MQLFVGIYLSGIKTVTSHVDKSHYSVGCRNILFYLKFPSYMTCTKFEDQDTSPLFKYHHKYVMDVIQYVGRRYMYHVFNWNSGELNLLFQFFARFAKMRKLISASVVPSIHQVVCPVLDEWISNFM